MHHISAERDTATHRLRAHVEDLAALLGFSTALAITAGVIKTPIGVPGHSAIFWIPVLVLAGCHRRQGMAVGAGLLGGMMAGLWCGPGIAKLAGLLAASAVVEAWGLGARAKPGALRMAATGALAHVGKLGVKVLSILVAGIPLNKAGLPLLPTLVLYAAFGIGGGIIAWGLLRAFNGLRRAP